MTKILWLSRHNLTCEQFSDLQRIYGEIELKHFKDSVTSYKDVIEAGNDCDVFAVVLPNSILTELTNPHNNQKPVIRAIANRVPTGNVTINRATGQEETEYMFQHVGWEKVLKIEIVTERL